MRDPKDVITLQHHSAEQERQTPGATGEFSDLLGALTLAIKTIAHEVRRAGLTSILGMDGSSNVHGEKQLKLDVYADEVMQELLARSGSVAIMGSEENEDPITVPRKYETGKYVVLFDPLDGSSNFDINASIGTIFSVFQKTSDAKAGLTDLLQHGRGQVAAGYALYGSSTMLVYTTGNGVHGFTLDPDIGDFILSHENMRIPAKGKSYHLNESYHNEYDVGTQSWLTAMKALPKKERPTARMIGTMVADVHRVLIQGGLFLNVKRFVNGMERTKLRLLYEANPMGWLIEQAGGVATTGTEPILDITPTTLHQTVSVVLGGKRDVTFYQSHLT